MKFEIKTNQEFRIETLDGDPRMLQTNLRQKVIGPSVSSRCKIKLGLLDAGYVGAWPRKSKFRHPVVI